MGFQKAIIEKLFCYLKNYQSIGKIFDKKINYLIKASTAMCGIKNASLSPQWSRKFLNANLERKMR